MKVTLTPDERLFFYQILPPKQDMLAAAHCHNMRERVRLSTEELESLNIREVRVGLEPELQWDEDVIEPKEFEFSAEEIRILKNQIDELDKNKNVNRYTLPLCEKFKDVRTEKSKKAAKEPELPLSEDA